ncbi:hypothetical protein [Salmonella enterica]|uniref:hypothetical protein n=1 Tax=Salmonella enterica TaxID=28901 RepID=UPI00193C8A0A|nr:hypothetical protein [Salmonella enterica]EEN5587742.1 hypothetical protein [Salmonella enterica subsp. enterica serovar Mountpleasant]
MSMRNMLLRSEWQQLTDGTNTVKIQILNTPVRYTESNVAPGSDTPFFLLQPGLYEAGPEISFVRADMVSAFIVVQEKTK